MLRLQILTIYLWIVFSLVCTKQKNAQDFITIEAPKVSIIAIRTDYCPHNWLQQILEQHPKPIVLQSLENAETPHALFSRNVLNVVCLLGNNFQSELLEPLLTALQNRRQEKFLFYLTGTTVPETVLALLRHCYEKKMLNVLVFKEFSSDNQYYSYSAFPHFALLQHSLRNEASYANRFPNMQGHPLIVLPDQRHPRSILHRDKKTRELLLTGSVGRFMRILAWKLNATLTYPFPMTSGKLLHGTELLELTRKLHVDIPGGLIIMANVAELNYSTYPFELAEVCLMIPYAHDIPLQDIFLILNSVSNVLILLAISYAFGLLLCLHKQLICRQRTYVVDFLLNDAPLRGLLGQSFTITFKSSLCLSLIYLILGTMGLNLSSIYQAMLGTMLTHPPKQHQPRTFEEVREAQLSMLISKQDSVPFRDMTTLKMLIRNDTEVYRQRDNMNTSYVYFASHLHWSLVNSQQKYFERPLFLFSKDACFSTLSLMSFHMPNNSWFTEPINKLTLEVRENGLYEYWLGLHFFDMAAADLVSFKDLSHPQHYGKSMQFVDLKWIWYIFVAMLFIACLVFALECVCYYRLHKQLLARFR